MIFPAIMLLATLTLPTVTFTEDSVYEGNKILTTTIQEEYDGTKTLKLQENYVFGYQIYDDIETDYIDGIKVDGEYLTSWTIHHWDDTVEHEIEIYTVYTDDFAGALAKAKDGDYSAIMENPIVYFQVVYYIFSIISIVISTIALRSVKKKNKNDITEIKNEVSNNFKKGIEDVVEVSTTALEEFMTKTYATLNSQYQDIIKALILSHSGTNDDTIALLDLLNKASTEDVSKTVEDLKNNILNTIKEKATSKANALNTISTISEKVIQHINKDDGTSI